MNRNYLFGCLAAAAVLGLLAGVFHFLFEIVPVTKFVPPSREARVNEYLALDRWLESSGISLRTESSGDLAMISSAREKQIFIQSSLFRWTGEAVDYLVQWVEEGGRLFLALDNAGTDNSGYKASGFYGDDDGIPMSLLEEFGIEVDTETAASGYRYNADSPGYDRSIAFEISDEVPQDEALAFRDWSGVTRLVQVKRGKGTLTVTGRPSFLLSTRLGRAPNARLAWALFAANSAPDKASPDKAAPGEAASNDVASGEAAHGDAASGETQPGFAGTDWLFIRGTAKVRGLLGSLFRQGNLPVLLVSALVLLVIGFWTLIPMFGLVRGDYEKPGKSLRERFLAEGRFLKRYGALEYYRGVYTKEIKRRLGRKEGLSDARDIQHRIMELWGKPSGERDSRFLVRLLEGGTVTYREFPRMITILKTILERI